MKKTKRFPLTDGGSSAGCPCCGVIFGRETDGCLYLSVTHQGVAIELIARRIFTFTCGGCRNEVQWVPAASQPPRPDTRGSGAELA